MNKPTNEVFVFSDSHIISNSFVRILQPALSYIIYIVCFFSSSVCYHQLNAIVSTKYYSSGLRWQLWLTESQLLSNLFRLIHPFSLHAYPQSNTYDWDPVQSIPENTSIPQNIFLLFHSSNLFMTLSAISSFVFKPLDTNDCLSSVGRSPFLSLKEIYQQRSKNPLTDWKASSLSQHQLCSPAHI